VRQEGDGQGVRRREGRVVEPGRCARVAPRHIVDERYVDAPHCATAALRVRRIVLNQHRLASTAIVCLQCLHRTHIWRIGIGPRIEGIREIAIVSDSRNQRSGQPGLTAVKVEIIDFSSNQPLRVQVSQLLEELVRNERPA